MRYIAIFLLLANIAYFAWNQYRPPHSIQQAPQSRALLNNGLMLVSEFEIQSVEQARLNEEAAKLCSIVSGFTSVDDANGFIIESRSTGLQSLLNLTGVPLDPQYRVYIVPASSRNVATITLDGVSERLAAADLQVETYLITRGLLENGIGLGVFAAEDGAVAVMGQVTELGYDVEIEEIPRSEGEIQVWLRPPDSGQVGDSKWLDLSADRPYLTRTENLCETIAQATQFP